jgi:hypothetical protein
MDKRGLNVLKFGLDCPCRARQMKRGVRKICGILVDCCLGDSVNSNVSKQGCNWDG